MVHQLLYLLLVFHLLHPPKLLFSLPMDIGLDGVVLELVCPLEHLLEQGEDLLPECHLIIIIQAEVCIE